MKCRWVKTIDSLGPSDPDEGTFTTLPSGDDLEVGSMPYPERNNEVTEYEEVWRKLTPTPGSKYAWILESVDRKTFLGRVGGAFLALHEGQDNSFGARSEEWTESDGWKVKYAIGAVSGVFSPSAGQQSDFQAEVGWKVHEKVIVGGGEFIVRGLQSL